MPVYPTYPGVYIQELPSPVHTIRGVPTAITAFVGAAKSGPVNDPISISSLGDFERAFGSNKSSPLFQAVSLFYQNGGGDAVVVRVAPAGLPNAEKSLLIDTATLPPVAGKQQQLTFQARSPGAGGNKLSISIDQENVPAAGPNNPVNQNNTYNLTVTDTASQATERYTGIAIDPNSPRALQRILPASSLIKVVSQLVALPAPPTPAPPTPPPPTPAAPTPPAAAPRAPAVPPLTLPLSAPLSLTLGGGDAGSQLPVEADLAGEEGSETGIHAVVKHNTFFNLLVLTPVYKEENKKLVDPPQFKPDVDGATLAKAAKFAKDHRAMLIADAPSGWGTVKDAKDGRDTFFSNFGTNKTNVAVYFPRLTLTDPDLGTIENVGPSAAIAGLYATTDDSRGVWKAAAGIAVQFSGIKELALRMSDDDNGRLNPIAINCLRSLPVVGNVIWGARTADGDDISASQWKYVPIRRLALYIEEALYRGTQWVVFEPNDEPLWAQVRLNVGAFMHTLFRQGAFQGTTAKDAYFVKCDKDTNPQVDIDNGILNVIVGFAPLKPAEFVIIKIQQIAGQIEV